MPVVRRFNMLRPAAACSPAPGASEFEPLAELSGGRRLPLDENDSSIQREEDTLGR